MIEGITFNSPKFKELLLYVAQKCADHVYFGATKLNKILFWSDFYSFGLTGKPITGATYQKLVKGPAPRQLPTLRKELIANGDAVLISRQIINHKQQRLVAKREPNVSLFRPEELRLVDQVIDVLSQQTAEEVSHLSHEKSAGWQLVDWNDDIPYFSVLIATDAPSPRDFERGRALVAQYGWGQINSTK